MRIVRTLRSLYRNLPRVLPLMRDARVPLGIKLATLAAALLIVSPLNVLGDIPGLGVFDDAVLLAFLANLFVGAASKGIAP